MGRVGKELEAVLDRQMLEARQELSGDDLENLYMLKSYRRSDPGYDAANEGEIV